MPTNRENAQFTSAIIGDDLLDKAIEWIQKKQAVQDIFDEDEILDYVRENHYPDAVFYERGTGSLGYGKRLRKSRLTAMPHTTTQPLTDADKMPFGRHAGKRMITVPAPYLLYLYRNGLTHVGVRGYINNNLAELEAAERQINQIKNQRR